MRHCSIQLLACLLFAVLMPLQAERVPDLREEASHVVEGEISGVFKKDAGEYVAYVVRIKAIKVDQGEGIKKGRFFYVEVFQRKPHNGPGPVPPGAAGHSSIPSDGQRVKIYANDKSGMLKGTYPNWYDRMPSVKAGS